MRSHSTATRTGTPPAAHQHLARDRHSSIDALSVIAGIGRDCPTATAPLSNIREEVTRPLALDIGQGHRRRIAGRGDHAGGGAAAGV
jgi:hypothetical protein